MLCNATCVIACSLYNSAFGWRKIFLIILYCHRWLILALISPAECPFTFSLEDRGRSNFWNAVLYSKYYRVIDWRSPQISNYKSEHFINEKNTVYFADLVPACLVCVISFSLWYHVIPLAMLATAFMNMEHWFGLCLQVEGNKLQLLL
jgi:hypothetical protein